MHFEKSVGKYFYRKIGMPEIFLQSEFLISLKIVEKYLLFSVILSRLEWKRMMHDAIA